MNNKKKTILIIVLAIILVVGVTVGYSFAYFTSSMINTTTPTNTAITTGSMAIEFTDGPEITLENAIPGSYVEKTFSVKNVGTLDTVYDIYMSDLINTFADKTDLVYTLTSSNGANVNETQVPATSSKIVSNQTIAANATQNYTLRIDFLETNDNQDDNKGKTFSTIIRINEVHDATIPGTRTIKKLVENEPEDSTDVIVVTTEEESCTNTLAYDGTEDNNLRYVGSSPCNIVSFNNGLWRIIGVMNNVETESGQTQSLLKLRSVERLGKYSWDTSTTDESLGLGEHGSNQWGSSGAYEGADLMRELNTDYLGNVTVGTDGFWYDSFGNGKNGYMPYSTISSDAQSMIESVVWHLGSPSSNNGVYDENWSSLISSTVYARERANTSGQVCTSIEDCRDNITRTSSWTGKVGLFYPSDYLYATSGGSTTNRTTCLGVSMGTAGWGSSSYSDCKGNDWLADAAQFQWTMSPFASGVEGRLTDSNVFYIHFNGYFNYNFSEMNYGVYPVIYLKSSVSITGGAGSFTNPYTLG